MGEGVGIGLTVGFGIAAVIFLFVFGFPNDYVPKTELVERGYMIETFENHKPVFKWKEK